MFDGGAFGVGVTATDLCPWPGDPSPPAIDPTGLVPPGATARPARLGEMLPVGSRCDADLAAELQRVVQVEGQLAAYKAELVAEFASRRPDRLDVPRGHPGAAAPQETDGHGRPEFVGTSEFFADELALVLNCSRSAATTLIGQAFALLHQLPATWAALADGELDWPRARGLAAELGEPAQDSDPAVLAQVEAALLPTAGDLSVRALRAAARRALFGLHPDAAERRRARAERAADVRSRPLGDGMGELTAFMPHPLVTALQETIDGYARMARADGDPRPLGQLRVAVLSDLVLRPWDTSREPFTAHLTVVVPVGGSSSAPSPDPAAQHGRLGGSAPAEVNGQPITAAQLRALLEQLDALCPGGLQAPAAGSMDIALVDPDTGALRATVSRRELERTARRGCPVHPPSDPARSTAMRGPAPHDVSRETCQCPVVDRPPPIDRYQPTPAQHRFVRTRDRTCRHPGCHNRAGWADLDHVTAHADGGETACENLCCLCRRHHRLKTHARGWRFVMTDDGVLSVTTPSGITRITRPPGLRRSPDHGQPDVIELDDDPPPF
ncbi:HNH endonuclease signature motif containing protein [Geodermatophilus sabuli]|uniref:HNH nuclease domain-containing protein n=1 Tax=Geodermatophilus sabuli TaxID=1564158 RepID=A0A285EEK2_9ACTN|nr:HNH endonuclease signature motif containing protein [Geodermatophilus sabuli]MBB3086211.1 hypothetical protein [Geodermatophilus sabuli]SNX97572.1 protein of unknown function [Geodermatophilus sabuli]